MELDRCGGPRRATTTDVSDLALCCAFLAIYVILAGEEAQQPTEAGYHVADFGREHLMLAVETDEMLWNKSTDYVSLLRFPKRLWMI